MNKIAEEINELLQEKCRLTLSELTTLYELPTAFMQEVKCLTNALHSTNKQNVIIMKFCLIDTNTSSGFYN